MQKYQMEYNLIVKCSGMTVHVIMDELNYF